MENNKTSIKNKLLKYCLPMSLLVISCGAIAEGSGEGGVVVETQLPSYGNNSMKSFENVENDDALECLSYSQSKHRVIPLDKDFLTPGSFDPYLFENKNILSEFTNHAYKVGDNKKLLEIVNDLKIQGWSCARFSGKKGIDFGSVLSRKDSFAGFVGLRKNKQIYEIVVAYHGTKSAQDALTDADAIEDDRGTQLNLGEDVRFHHGFSAATLSTMPGVQAAIRALLEKEGLLEKSPISQYLSQLGIDLLDSGESDTWNSGHWDRSMESNEEYIVEDLNQNLLHDIIANKIHVKIVFAGHSLGGAMAVLGPANFIFNAKNNTESSAEAISLLSVPNFTNFEGKDYWEVVNSNAVDYKDYVTFYTHTHGAPQVFDLKGGMQYISAMGNDDFILGLSRCVRYVYGFDIVPSAAFMFTHAGYLVPLGEQRSLTVNDVINGKPGKDHKNTNYLSSIQDYLEFRMPFQSYVEEINSDSEHRLQLAAVSEVENETVEMSDPIEYATVLPSEVQSEEVEVHGVSAPQVTYAEFQEIQQPIIETVTDLQQATEMAKAEVSSVESNAVHQAVTYEGPQFDFAQVIETNTQIAEDEKLQMEVAGRPLSEVGDAMSHAVESSLEPEPAKKSFLSGFRSKIRSKAAAYGQKFRGIYKSISNILVSG